MRTGPWPSAGKRKSDGSDGADGADDADGGGWSGRDEGMREGRAGKTDRAGYDAGTADREDQAGMGEHHFAGSVDREPGRNDWADRTEGTDGDGWGRMGTERTDWDGADGWGRMGSRGSDGRSTEHEVQAAEKYGVRSREYGVKSIRRCHCGVA